MWNTADEAGFQTQCLLIVLLLLLAYKPSKSMIGKKLETRQELEPCSLECYLIEYVSIFP